MKKASSFQEKADSEPGLKVRQPYSYCILFSLDVSVSLTFSSYCASFAMQGAPESSREDERKVSNSIQ